MINSREEALEILGLDPTKEFSNIELKKKYYQQALALHPDKIAQYYPHCSAEEKKIMDENNTKEFQKLSEAYQYLTSPLTRSFHDEFTESCFSSTCFSSKEFFDNFFNTFESILDFFSAFNFADDFFSKRSSAEEVFCNSFSSNLTVAYNNYQTSEKDNKKYRVNTREAHLRLRKTSKIVL